MKKPYTDNDELPEVRISSRNGTTAKPLTRESIPHMSPAQHFDEAKNALADGYKIDVNPAKTVWGRVGSAQMHLKAIEPVSSQYVPAQHLMREVRSRKRQLKNMSMHVTHELMVKQREMMASEFEQYYVSKGIIVEVELSGPDKTCISLLSSLFNKASVDRIVNRSNLFTYLTEAGFKRVILGNNEENVWTYNLKAQ